MFYIHAEKLKNNYNYTTVIVIYYILCVIHIFLLAEFASILTKSCSDTEIPTV